MAATVASWNGRLFRLVRVRGQGGELADLHLAQIGYGHRVPWVAADRLERALTGPTSAAVSIGCIVGYPVSTAH